MKLPTCFLCQRPVLELDGQFEKFDSYLLQANDDASIENAFGWCHSVCLVRSKWGAFWADRRFRHTVETLGWTPLPPVGDLRAARNPRDGDALVIQNDGVSFIVPSKCRRSRDVQGGVLVPVDEELNLELADIGLADRICAALRSNGVYPIFQLLDHLGISDRLLFPEAVMDGELVYDEELAEDWGDGWISAQARYARFIPAHALAIASHP